MKINRRIKNLLYFRPNYKIITKRILTLILILFILILVLPMNLVFRINKAYKHLIYDNPDDVPGTRVAIVLGAGLDPTYNEPSGILKDRLDSAIELYKKGKVQKIIMSGDNRFVNYNEPQVMINYAIANGVNEIDLQPDFAGRRTYDTCYRARAIFSVDKAIIITQNFHLPRALYLCNSLGIETIGYSADIYKYEEEPYFQMRDYLALVLSYWELLVDPPEVVLGEKIKV